MTHTDETGLYTLQLEEFTAARNALAGQMKKAGRIEDAERIRKLEKPSLPAWAVNQLYWRHRKAYDRLVSVGERFRKAQAAQLAGKGGDLRGALDARREAVAELARMAATLLEQAGHTATPDVMRRISTTLDALAAYGSDDAGPRPGTLADDLAPPGFEALAALVPKTGAGAGGGKTPRVIPFQQKAAATKPSARARKKDPQEEARRRQQEQKAAAAAARAAVRQAERDLESARRAAERAEAELRKAAARAKETERTKVALEKEFEKAAAAFDEARSAARRIASEAEAAAQAVDDAERGLAQAKRELEALGE